MHVKAIKTHRIEIQESLESIFECYLKDIEENDIIAITSKIISLSQGRVVKKEDISKYELIRKEADLILESPHNPYNFYLTIKNGILIPTAGIDASNVDGVYVLYPQDIQKTACSIWHFLRTKYSIQNLGILITDSHTTIMRPGVTGIALGWCGLEPLYSYIGKPDIYDNPLCVTCVNILDALATSAVFVMGEGNEQTPISLIKEAPQISFLDRIPTEEEEKSITIPYEEDLYGPLLMSGRWVKQE